jgi:hypothetical protein
MHQRTLAVLYPGGQIDLVPDELSSEEAAFILDSSVRFVQERCKQGMLEEGKDWRKTWVRGARGQYLIKRDAVLRLLDFGRSGY